MSTSSQRHPADESKARLVDDSLRNTAQYASTTSAFLQAAEHDIESYGADSTHELEGSARTGLIRRVYTILTLQLAFTGALSAAAMLIPAVQSALIGASKLVLILSLVVVIGSLIFLAFNFSKHPHNLYGLSVFTVAEAFSVATICAMYSAAGMTYTVLQALIVTGCIFTGLTLYAFTSKTDFSFMHGALYAGLIGLVSASCLRFVLGIFGVHLAWMSYLISLAASFLFSLYILYDSMFCTLFLRSPPTEEAGILPRFRLNCLY